jgi:methylthioribose-1-phosphate isomerase
VVVRTIQWKNDQVILLDQRRLPEREIFRTYSGPRGVARAIRDMVVRGAPAIGVAAAMGVALGALRLPEKRFHREFPSILEFLEKARPTAANLFWATNRMRKVYVQHRRKPVGEIKKRLKREALAMFREDIERNQHLGRHGARVIPKRARVLTHCNTGALATAGFGTALGVVRVAWAQGKSIEVIVGETRPVLQGARLTAWELCKEKIPVTVVADSTVGSLMQRGLVDVVVVGSDRIAANGDVANKIGTYPLAVLAHRHGIPFYVAAPTSTIDLACPNGARIPIEERGPEEVTGIFRRRMMPPGVKVLNPAFDVTPHEIVTAIITEKGLLKPPFRTSLRRVLDDHRKKRPAD